MSENITTETTAVESAVVAPVAKAPSKKSQGDAIFQAKLVEQSQGLFASNREFRAAVLSAIIAELGVSVASAATMYNTCKKEAEAAGTVTLGRDPKKEKAPKGTAKRGRPAGSKNQPKAEVPAEAAATDTPAEAAAETPVAEVVQEPAAAI